MKATALDAYMTQVACVSIMVEELQDYADSLHDTNPDTLKWSDVANIERVASMLREITKIIKQ
jgi:hypothetical protein